MENNQNKHIVNDTIYKYTINDEVYKLSLESHKLVNQIRDKFNLIKNLEFIQKCYNNGINRENYVKFILFNNKIKKDLENYNIKESKLKSSLIKILDIIGQTNIKYKNKKHIQK